MLLDVAGSAASFPFSPRSRTASFPAGLLASLRTGGSASGARTAP